MSQSFDKSQIQAIQKDLEIALSNMKNELKGKIKDSEFHLIEEEFNEINEILERLKTGLIWIALFGKTCVGKSAVGNALVGEDFFGVNPLIDWTKEAQWKEKRPWMIIDIPGFMGERPELASEAVQQTKKAHARVFIIDGLSYGPEMNLFDEVYNANPEVPTFIFVNKLDVLEAAHDEDELSIIRQTIEEKMGKYVISKEDIVYGSAKLRNPNTRKFERVEIPELLERMYEGAGTFSKVLNIIDPANRASGINRTIDQKIFEARQDVARRLIMNYAVACSWGSLIPGSSLAIQPIALNKLINQIYKVMGVPEEKFAEAEKIREELFSAVLDSITTEGLIWGAAGALAFVPIVGHLAAALLGVWGSVFHEREQTFERVLVFGEAALSYIRNDFKWDGDSCRATIERVKTQIKPIYEQMKRK
jgi:GTP-binding protein EngB required for normal cell division